MRVFWLFNEYRLELDDTGHWWMHTFRYFPGRPATHEDTKYAVEQADPFSHRSTSTVEYF